MLRHSLTVVACLSLLAACAGRSVTSSPAPPTAALAPPPMGAILLTQESDPTRHDPRNVAVCEEYIAYVSKEGQGDAAQSRARDIIRTFWLDKRPTPSTPASCQEALDDYDFERADSEIKKLRPAVTGKGPFLVTYNRAAAPRLVVDGSAVDTDETLRAAVADYLASAGDRAARRAASTAVAAARPRRRRTVCEVLLDADTRFDGTGNMSVGAYFAGLAVILVAEAAICAIGV